MVRILHYASADNQSHDIFTYTGKHKAIEYIVLTEDTTSLAIAENKKAGFVFEAEYKLDGDIGSLPTDRILIP